MIKKAISLISLIILISACSLNNSEEEISSTEETQNTVVVETWSTDIIEEESFSNTDWSEMSEEEFNNSWRAKAIESETDLWDLFDDVDNWFQLNYPLNTTMLSNDEYPENNDNVYYKINVKNIGLWDDEPMSLSKEEEEKTIKALSSWEFWENPDFIFEDSKKVTPVANIFAQDYLVLGRFDVCDVALERSVVFYLNNKEIKITSYAPTNKLKEIMPEYFTTDQDNCWEELMWNSEKQAELYSSLIDGVASNEIQTWFTDFDKAIETITFND